MESKERFYRKAIIGLFTLSLVLASFVFFRLYFKDTELLDGLGLGFLGGKNPEILVKKTVLYLSCGCKEEESCEHVDKNTKEMYMESLGDEWSVAGDAKDSLQLERKVTGYCPLHEHTRLITLGRGHVLVYRGDKAQKQFLIKEYVELEENLLSAKDKQVLKRGVLLEGSKDDPVDVKVAKYLEGILD